LMFGYLQHQKIKPMYGRSGGSVEFRIAREDWNQDVIRRLRWLKQYVVKIPPAGTLKQTYVSPFDGQIK